MSAMDRHVVSLQAMAALEAKEEEKVAAKKDAVWEAPNPTLTLIDAVWEGSKTCRMAPLNHSRWLR